MVLELSRKNFSFLVAHIFCPRYPLAAGDHDVGLTLILCLSNCDKLLSLSSVIDKGRNRVVFYRTISLRF
jgi:hypothetical protein